VDGPFLLDFAGVHIIRYFGSEREVIIPGEIEELGCSSFSTSSVSTVRFGLMSNLSVIGNQAFELCDDIQSITIPSRVRILGQYCFSGCESLQFVSFEPDSQLTIISKRAFECCSALKSIVLPYNLEIIGESCFFNCRGLEAVTFQSGSHLLRIEGWAFQACFSLKSLSFPPLLEFVGGHCFVGSPSFSTLTFSSPSRVRELLDVPALAGGFIEIPDSVEVLQLSQPGGHPDSCTLTFGDESGLRGLRAKIKPVGLFGPSVGRFGYFVRVTTRSLKLIRSNLEFDESG
jgi:hypothetical protein